MYKQQQPTMNMKSFPGRVRTLSNKTFDKQSTEEKQQSRASIPLILMQVGIVAWGIGCGNASPGVYADLTQLGTWVQAGQPKPQSNDKY